VRLRGARRGGGPVKKRQKFVVFLSIFGYTVHIMPVETALSVGGERVFSIGDSEMTLVDGALARLDAENPLEAELDRQRLLCLTSFEETLSHFPLVRDSEMFKDMHKGSEPFSKALAVLAPSANLLRVHPRIVTVRSFLVTKFHTFSSLCKAIAKDSEIYNPLKNVVFSILFTIMAEDVYFSCLEEPSLSDEIKFSLSEDLLSFWDSGAELTLVKHFPALKALWIARNDSPPSFGTLDGASEIFRISIDLGNDWHDFLMSHMNDDETKWALDEFLFALSYEELILVRSRLHRFGVNAVSFSEIRSYLGSKPAYLMTLNREPSVSYDFYMDRKEAARNRKQHNAPGPHRTLEEIYLMHRISA
jgi:hypothetical protein